MYHHYYNHRPLVTVACLYAEGRYTEFLFSGHFIPQKKDTLGQRARASMISQMFKVIHDAFHTSEYNMCVSYALMYFPWSICWMFLNLYHFSETDKVSGEWWQPVLSAVHDWSKEKVSLALKAVCFGLHSTWANDQINSISIILHMSC